MKDDIKINKHNKHPSHQANGLSHIDKNKNDPNFKKLKNTGPINTLGEHALIIYKKIQKKNPYVVAKTLTKNQENNQYISDGGLKKKIFKFKNPPPPKNPYPISPSAKNKLVKNPGSENNKKQDLPYSENLYKTMRTNIKCCSLFPQKNKTSNNNTQKKCLSDNERNKNINDLIKNTFMSSEKLINNPAAKKITPKELFTERKKKILSVYGIDFSKIDLDIINGGLENNGGEENEKNNIKKNNINKNSKSVNDILYDNTKKKHLFLNNINYDDYDRKSKKNINKPEIDQFEYLKKIYICSKKLSKKLNTAPSSWTSNNKLNESFRHKNIEKKYSESISKDDEYPYAHKYCYRTSKEIKHFLKEKKNKEKKINEEEEIKKNKQLFIRYQNLCKLMKDYNRKNINSKSPNYKKKHNVNKKKCELNEYYLGLNNSTIVDPNDYYFNVLESQQLFNQNTKSENSGTKYNLSEPNAEVFTKNKIQNNKNNYTQPKKISPKTMVNNYVDKKNNLTDKSKKNNMNKIFNIKNNVKENIIPKEKEKIPYSKNNINKLITLIKKLFHKTGFSIIYTEAMKQAIMQHYYVALSFFISIFKRNAFTKLQEYCFYKEYGNMNDQNMKYNKNCIESFVEFLSVFFKMKIIEKIYNYSKRQVFEKAIKTSIKNLLKPHLKNYFEKLKNYKPEKINSLNDSPLHKKADTSISEKMNSYIYESLDNESESSISINPNSVDNDRLHQLKMMIFLRRQMLNSDVEEENEKNSHSQITELTDEDEKQNDISAEKDKITDIEWDYKIENLNKKNDNRKKLIKDNEEYPDEFLNSEELEQIKKNLINTNVNSNENSNAKNRYPQEINNNEEESLNNEEDNIIQKNIDDEKCKTSLIKLKKIYDNDKISDDFTNDIINKILFNEILNPKLKIIPHKSFKNQICNNLANQSSISNTSSNFGSMSKKESTFMGQLSLQDDSLSSLNDSIMSSYSVFSFFNKTIKDKKKQHSLNLYINFIAPKLIKLITKVITEKYSLIYDNISTPLQNNSAGLMVSLFLQNTEILKQNFKCPYKFQSISDIIDKEKILKIFEPINKKIRFKDNITSDNFYDNMLNECIIETTIEIITNERLYGANGNPLKWSSRTHELVFKYKKNDPKPLCELVKKKLYYFLHNRIGLLVDNYDYMNVEQINIERGKRLGLTIKKEFEDNENQWTNLEVEETQIKIEVTEKILDQFISETLEILEHIQYSRERPDLYQGKSIYGCEVIPKLSFQLASSENNKSDDNDLINI